MEIVGKRTVVAKVFKCSPDEEGRGLICIDGLTRTSAGVTVDENVTVRKCEPAFAQKVVLAPNIPEGKKIRFEDGIENIFLNGLLGRPLIAETDIIVPNIALMGNRSTFTGLYEFYGRLWAGISRCCFFSTWNCTCTGTVILFIG